MLSADCRRALAVILAAAALVPSSGALAATCAGGAASPLTLGSATTVAPGDARSFALDLSAGQGVIVDLANLTPPAPVAAESGEDGETEAAKPAPRNLALCDAGGKLLAPMAGEVFEKGGSVADTPDGQRLRFVAPSAGRYVVSVTASDAPRELLARGRDLGSSGGVTAVALGAEATGTASSAAPQTYSFAGTAGQWVELRSTSEKDTLLNLAGPGRDGSYAVMGSNDDSDGLNPLLRRRLPVSGTYFVQVDSLSAEPGEFTLSIKGIPTPPPPAPPLALRSGARISAKLDSGDDVKLYALSVTAGHRYDLELTAPYDAVVAIGLPNPVEADDADAKDAGFSEIKSQDANLTGTERLSFTAVGSGQVLIRVKSFGIDESDGGYSLKVTDQGG